MTYSSTFGVRSLAAQRPIEVSQERRAVKGTVLQWFIASRGVHSITTASCQVHCYAHGRSHLASRSQLVRVSASGTLKKEDELVTSSGLSACLCMRVPIRTDLSRSVPIRPPIRGKNRPIHRSVGKKGSDNHSLSFLRFGGLGPIFSHGSVDGSVRIGGKSVEKTMETHTLFMMASADAVIAIHFRGAAH